MVLKLIWSDIMSLKLFHTSDLHIGMKFNRYPEDVKELLVNARIEILERLINLANERQCDIFTIAGDLFDKISRIPKKDLMRVIKILNGFSGEVVLIIPGNHDYDNGVTELWEDFQNNITEKILLLNHNKCYDLSMFDINATIYPAFCDKKHSKENNLQWIKKLDKLPDSKFHIGMAHGALKNISPDLENKYFNMSEEELLNLNLDLWLIGHTHIPYPNNNKVKFHKVYNAGTPEPDGMDCNHEGSAWFIELDENKNVTAESVKTGRYKFMDIDYKIEDENDFKNLNRKFYSDNILARINLNGRIDRKLYENRYNYYNELSKKLVYLDIDDTNLGIKITKEVIEKEFTKDSFPYQFLKGLYEDSQDEDALQLAYELILEVKE
ncbi:MAG: DNA repair exonuclease [Firmicutes bacterium]|nr:DNA repair exonuclease [Bacillota bacterium]